MLVELINFTLYYSHLSSPLFIQQILTVSVYVVDTILCSEDISEINRPKNACLLRAYILDSYYFHLHSSKI